MSHYISCTLIVLSALMTFSSCSTKKNSMSYFNDLDRSMSGVLSTMPTTVVIEPESELVILVKSEVPEATAEFNPTYVNPATPGTQQVVSQPQLETYRVDANGYIDFPKLGKIKVAGMTTYELKDFLVKRISEYVKEPVVSVNLTGYRVVVMGEVRTPKTVETSADRFSVLDALAEAGDLTDYALRENILVLRRLPDGDIEYNRINLLDSKCTQSQAFWLKNNDVVYVSPNKVKQDNSKYNQNNAYKLSLVSTVVGVSSAIISLVIALAIK